MNIFIQLWADKLKLASLVLTIAALTSAMSVVQSKHQNRLLFVELESLNTQRDEMNVEWGQLQLELSTWATDSRVEKIATEKLNMRNVSYEDTVIIKL